MTPSNPRRPRRFTEGTDAEWEHALSQPAVRQALGNPQIQQALLQNMQGQSAAPAGMAEGGKIGDGIPDPQTIEKLQQLQDEQKSEWMPTRYADGGGVLETPTQLIADLEREIANPTTAPGVRQRDQLALQQLQQSQMGALGGLGAGTSGSGALSAQNLIGLQRLAQMGGPTIANTAIPAAIAGVTGLGVQGNVGIGGRLGAAALSAGTAALLNYLIRRNAKQNQTTISQTGGPGGGGPGGGGPGGGQAGGPSAVAQGQGTQSAIEQGLIDPSYLAPGTPLYDTQYGFRLDQNLNRPSGSGLDAATQDAIDQGYIDPSYLMGYAEGGDVHDDAAQDRKQMLGILREKRLLKKRGGRAEFARGGIADIEPPRKPPGKEVLRRAPLGRGHAIPALVTTIVITAKPKKKAEKKAEGGTIEIPESRLDKRARKPRAIPPKKGPANGDQYAPYQKGGHVQVPRGSGVATKGRRFSGIY